MKVIFLSLAIYVAYSATEEVIPYCRDSDEDDVKFSLYSNRNISGNWTAKFQLEHDVDTMVDGHREVHVEQSTKKCGSKDTVIITGTIGHIGSIGSIGNTVLAVPTGESPPKIRAPSDYRYLPGAGYFKGHKTAKIWADAESTCKEEGGHLAVLNSASEARFLASLWTFGGSWAFIGFSDIYEEGRFVTIFNQTLREAGYNTWYPGEPDGGATQNCGVMNFDTRLATNFCHGPLSFFCEIN